MEPQTGSSGHFTDLTTKSIQNLSNLTRPNIENIFVARPALPPFELSSFDNESGEYGFENGSEKGKIKAVGSGLQKCLVVKLVV